MKYDEYEEWLYRSHDVSKMLVNEVDERLNKYNNLPHNGHPNALPNREYADKLDSFLRAEILKKG